jgi:hypothetical protein
MSKYRHKKNLSQDRKTGQKNTIIKHYMYSDRNKKKPDTGQKITYYTTDNFFGDVV